ncbi:MULTISPECIES: hypothetical protein [Aliivibrio]|jgi:hypothetical protein|uniref:Exported protein n=1 Tax=Aliivibrio salmonicida (strain LFI1238) TaxID=316275 RepID=B6EJQ2_ALISL|nr:MULTISPECIES: hypothetical protein [Aliivibrio]MBB1315201.1 hypothetical protein [Aliivibrio sp. SR45-2]CAQ80033.1 putative exported protein [Aliivibrio salmonicida LFI1238]
MKYRLLAILIAAFSSNVFALEGSTEIGPKVSCEQTDGTVVMTYATLCKAAEGTIKSIL